MTAIWFLVIVLLVLVVFLVVLLWKLARIDARVRALDAAPPPPAMEALQRTGAEIVDVAKGLQRTLEEIRRGAGSVHR